MTLMKVDKFMAHPDGFYSPICNECKNKYKGARCKAFNRIPDEILDGSRGHSKPLDVQDNDIVFESIGD